MDLISSHEEISDENQTVEFKNSTIRTSAKEKESEPSNPASKKPIMITDTLAFNDFSYWKRIYN
ncbi:hypothetical protein ALNOE001_06250 [Candidatus Methanobinarius endosymbioticus]|uniref:Uncharacterized protein n=1 Tax=Candidatus Methanobinarius endosymbioticus TaxID=2006182 RepID=A0A366MEH3_9EURY|nr:hypothetical protein ALNOE001_06250 [Candidatus Methanobinarius endosymbioticus]